MGTFLNSIIPYEAYNEIVSDLYFVDKSTLIKELFPYLGKRNRYLCITRPRRFGKSVMANMVGAFFSNAVDSHCIFDTLAISKDENYPYHLNKHNVIFIDFSKIPRDCTTYERYISRIENGIKKPKINLYLLWMNGENWEKNQNTPAGFSP